MNIANAEMEALYIEIDKGNFNLGKNIIVGVIYRAPGEDMTNFIEDFTTVLEIIKKEDKLAYFMGDFNINLLNEGSHIKTNEFIENILSYSFFPLITKPTRISKTVATLIDNIYSNHFFQTIIQFLIELIL